MRHSISAATALFLYLSPGAQAPADKPQRLQLYPRDSKNQCTVPYLAQAPAGTDSLVLEVFADGTPKARFAKAPAAGAAAFAVPVEAALVQYRFALSRKQGAAVTPIESADSVVCGDAYVIAGQSNANASRGGQLTGNPFVRGFGPNNFFKGFDLGRFYRSWGLAEAANDYSKDTAGIGHVGYWGYKLGDSLTKAYQVPVAFILSAVGGTAISFHMRGYVEKDTGRIAWDTVNQFNQLRKKVVASGLSGAIQAVFWHQGEWDQWDGHPSPYAAKFDTLFKQWKEVMPNLKKAYLWQIPPSACGRGTEWSSPLRESQRRIALQPYANLLTNLATAPEEYSSGDNCHWRSVGYAQMARDLFPLVARDFYGAPFQVLTAPNILAAGYSNGDKTEIKLEFDQEVRWEDSLTPGRIYADTVLKRIGQQYLKDWLTLTDDTATKVVSGSASGKVVTVKLSGPGKAKQVSYVHRGFYARKFKAPGATDSSQIRFSGPFIWGRNGQPALTFFRYPVADQFQPTSLARELRAGSPSRGVRSRDGEAWLEFAPGRDAPSERRDLRGRRLPFSP